MIPVKRDDELDWMVRPETDDDAAERERIHRNTLAGDGWYRRESRARR